MNFLLKIVEGPNKGAEIALVEGVAVTLGKGDSCDIVLADLTLPDAPVSVRATADGVTVDGAAQEPFAVRTLGATSFAVGPADAPWGELKWPKDGERGAGGERETGGGESRGEDASSRAPRSAPEGEAPPPDEEKKPPSRKRGCGCGCIVALLALLLVVAGIFWFLRERRNGSDRLEQFEEIGRGWYSRVAGGGSRQHASESKASLSDVAEKYGLRLDESNGVARISGNLGTRRERLAATAEAYQAQPGVSLDLTDDESFRTAAEDALFTFAEGALKVLSATNRVLSIAGTSSSPMSLKKVLEALNSDLPRLRDVDVSGVTIGGMGWHGQETADEGREDGAAVPRVSRPASRKKDSTDLPVCGILTAPYPCLVMRDGRRVMPGAAIGDSVIVEIGADSVVLTNSTGRFTWKP